MNKNNFFAFLTLILTMISFQNCDQSFQPNEAFVNSNVPSQSKNKDIHELLTDNNTEMESEITEDNNDPEGPNTPPPSMENPMKSKYNEPSSLDNVRFVTTQGNDSNSGLSENSAWKSIAFAVSQSEPGMTIFVKAGLYNKEFVTFPKSGTSESPIVLEGYQKTPGDRPIDLSFDHTKKLNSNLAPLLDGQNRAMSNAAIQISNKQHIVVRNLQIQNYNRAVQAYGSSYIKVMDISGRDFGDINDKYDGKGIIMGSGVTHSLIYRSTIVNPCAEGIAFYGNDNVMDEVRIYSDDNRTDHYSALDYYLLLVGHRNIIRNSLAHRVGDLGHLGHGIGIKGSGENNLIENSVAINVVGGGFYLRHRGAKNNIYKNNTVINGGYAFLIRDGANNNVIDGCFADNTKSAIVFLDTTEDGGKQSGGHDNIIKNCHFKDVTFAVFDYARYNYRDTTSFRNIFDNVTVDKAAALFNINHIAYDEKITNSKLNNIEKEYITSSPNKRSDLSYVIED